jgi:predicted ABC-class ATPase
MRQHAAMHCRASGASDLPLTDSVPFKSPPALEVELQLPNAGAVRGMGIRKGITLIVGGGYNGKSTLLQALEKGVYNKVRRC